MIHFFFFLLSQRAGVVSTNTVATRGGPEPNISCRRNYGQNLDYVSADDHYGNITVTRRTRRISYPENNRINWQNMFKILSIYSSRRYIVQWSIWKPLLVASESRVSTSIFSLSLAFMACLLYTFKISLLVLTQYIILILY